MEDKSDRIKLLQEIQSWKLQVGKLMTENANLHMMLLQAELDSIKGSEVDEDVKDST